MWDARQRREPALSRLRTCVSRADARGLACTLAPISAHLTRCRAFEMAHAEFVDIMGDPARPRRSQGLCKITLGAPSCVCGCMRTVREAQEHQLGATALDLVGEVAERRPRDCGRQRMRRAR